MRCLLLPIIQVTSLEYLVNQEQALHIVTKTQLQGAEDEVHRLKQHLTVLRRKHSDIQMQKLVLAIITHKS